VAEDILLLTARAHLDALAVDRLRARLHDVVDWAAIISVALKHGTAPLLCRHLLRHVPDLSPEFRHAAGAYLDSWHSTADVAVEELLCILDALAAIDIPAIPFKGPALALQAYGDLRLRTYRDLDVLIRPEHIAPTMRILADLGYWSRMGSLGCRQKEAYYRYNGQDILFAEGRMPVEPHWDFAPRTFSAHLDVDGMWQRTLSIPIRGRTTQVLSPEDVLLVAALHGAKEQWARLLWIVDIAEHLRRHPGLDWDAALQRATDAGLCRILLLGVMLAEQLLQAPVPDTIRSMMRAEQTAQALAQRVQARLLMMPQPQTSVFTLSSFQWRARERWSDRWSYAVASLTTARLQHLRMINLPAPFSFAYPAVKVAHDYLALPIWLACKAVQSRRPHRRAGSHVSES